MGPALHTPLLVSCGAVARGRRSKPGPAVAGNEPVAAARAGVEPGRAALKLVASATVAASAIPHLVVTERAMNPSRVAGSKASPWRGSNPPLVTYRSCLRPS